MPPLGNKSKTKVKENRQSRSRNTTPSSVLSAPGSSSTAGLTVYLEIPLASLIIPSTLLYDDLLEHHGGGGIPDPKNLEALANDLRALSELAATRENACDSAMRNLSQRRKLRHEEELEQFNREAEEKSGLKRSAEDDDVDKAAKSGKLKKRKEQVKAREERPLAHGAHGLARQDGRETTPKGKASASPGKVKSSAASGSSSSLSPPSQVQSPTATNQKVMEAPRASPAPSSSSEDSHQPPPAASVPQYQTFGSNPLTFEDPTIYHIRDVTPDMTDDEKKEIYCVASFPQDDLKHLTAGEPPDKDFSNAKPTSQVNANTFQSYLEPYFRPLTEEDLTFLKERGDRATPFIIARRGTKHYKQIWAEEDAALGLADPPPPREKLPENQPRGSVEQVDDDTVETDQVSGGPVLNRLLATMRYEHRPEEKDRPNGLMNGEATVNGLTNGDHASDLPDAPSFLGDEPSARPPATAFAESANPNWKVPTTRPDFGAVDERLKAELRYIGFLGAESEPDYDAHYDDEVAQRLRFLQAELRRVMIMNGARKARVLQLAEEQMGFQEYGTIRDDLDNQVIQAFLKRNRTLGKGKKNVKRPAGGAGGAHPTTGVVGAAGTSKPGIGDVARLLLDRRQRWKGTVEPVFSDNVTRVRGSGDSIFKPEDMGPFIQAEKERLEEESAD